ncbi:unknown [Anaerotruncus sp. CAG:390]|nr:unknown [Anaerotruncus sp. CAG:390]
MCSSKSSTTRTVNTETERLIFLFLSGLARPTFVPYLHFTLTEV